MKFLIGSNIARQYNLTGQRGKRCFQSLSLYQLLYGMNLLAACAYRVLNLVLERYWHLWFRLLFCTMTN